MRKICIEQADDGAFSVYDEAAPDGVQQARTVEQALAMAGELLNQDQGGEQTAVMQQFKQGLAETAPQRPMMPQR